MERLFNLIDVFSFLPFFYSAFNKSSVGIGWGKWQSLTGLFQCIFIIVIGRIASHQTYQRCKLPGVFAVIEFENI